MNDLVFWKWGLGAFSKTTEIFYEKNQKYPFIFQLAHARA